MKKYFKLFIVFICFSFFQIKNVYGISEDFEFVINTIGVPKYNVYGQEINEDVYYTYNVFAYSSPKEASLNSAQGFKETSLGKWTSSNTKYNGSGQRGEYYFLGREYNGSLISNVYYPVSFFPDNTPEYWTYMYMNDAYSSWNDSSKYKYSEQLEYMKNSKILYDFLDFSARTTDPYNLVKYNITANSIGLDKIMLDTCSTWKTQGIMNVVRKDLNGAIRYSIFAIEPMAASATVKSNLTVDEVYVLTENEKEKEINITFGAEAINLTDYARPKHIKEIKSDLYINGQKVSSVIGNKKTSISKSYIYTLSRENENSYPLYIEVKSSLYTEFAVDGLMKDGLSKTVNVTIEKYKQALESAEIKELTKENNKIYVNDLVKTLSTEEADSVGIIQQGRHLCLKLETDFDDNYISIYLNNNKVNYTKLLSKDGCVFLEIDVIGIANTIASWNYLRNYYNNYFTIKNNDIGKRVASPNEIKIVINGIEKVIKFDTIDNFNININYKLYGVVNKEDVYAKIEIEKW